MQSDRPHAPSPRENPFRRRGPRLAVLAILVTLVSCGDKEGPSSSNAAHPSSNGEGSGSGSGSLEIPADVEYVDRTKTGEVFGQSGRTRHAIDREIIEQLVAAGADPAKPHRIEHHFGAVNRGIAQKIVDWARENGYASTEVIEDKSDAGLFYYVDVINETPLELETVARDSRRMETLAATIDCEYDGWGCELVE